MYQINILYTLNLHNVTCQLCLNKNKLKKKGKCQAMLTNNPVSHNVMSCYKTLMKVKNILNLWLEDTNGKCVPTVGYTL